MPAKKTGRKSKKSSNRAANGSGGSSPRPSGRPRGESPQRATQKTASRSRVESSTDRKRSAPSRGTKAKPAKMSTKKTVEPQAAETSEKRSAARRPLSARQAKVLLDLETAMARRIVGKDDAIARIARVVRVRITQLDSRPDRPNGSILLVGPTGVGKNEVAYALAEVLLGSEERVISIDLGELAEEGDLAKLGVTPIPGSDTQVMEGLLTSPDRRDPEAVILLRGLERAHSSFYPILQQILERGKLDDMMGTVSFSQNIIFVTTRPRRDDPHTLEIGFSRTALPPQEALRKRLEWTFAPDFLDAFNEIIELPPLSPEDVRRIARYKVGAVLKRLQRRRKEVAVADNVYEAFIPDEEANREGAAMLNRTLEDRLFNPLARYMLANRSSRSIRVEMVNGALRIHE